MALGEGVSGEFLLKLGEIPMFSTFGVKLAIFSRVSRAGVVVEGVWGLGTMRDCVSEEKMVGFGEFSL